MESYWNPSRKILSSLPNKNSQKKTNKQKFLLDEAEAMGDKERRVRAGVVLGVDLGVGLAETVPAGRESS